jgi:predicted amidohydrolase
LAICRDTGVAEHIAATAAAGMDVYVAGVLFAAHESERRDVRMREIARRHGVWVALASFAGPTGDYPQTSGGSGVWAPNGDVLVQAGPGTGAWVAATLVDDRHATID